MVENNVIFCTYFDRGFLLKGLALHDSLIKHNPEARLWVLVFDRYSERILKKMDLKGVTVVPLREFEDKELRAVKKTRSSVEYYWTCTPSWPLYIFEKVKNAGYVVYLDADLYFYSDPMAGVNEIRDCSLLAVEHRFPKGRENMALDAGRFNVAFNVFKNDAVGIRCLKRWREQCLDWCYWKAEDGRLGDQMYLDEWPKLYKEGLVVSKNKGVDAAPWNISQNKVVKLKGGIFVDSDRLVCYHFHQFQILGPNNFYRVYGYTLSKNVVEYIYKPYEEELRRQYKKVKKADPNFEVRVSTKTKIDVLKYGLVRNLGPIYWRIRSLLNSG